MVKFTQNLDRNKKIYIPKPLREAGFSESLVIIPDNKAAVMFSEDTELKEVEKSLLILLQDIRQQIQSIKEHNAATVVSNLDIDHSNQTVGGETENVL